MALETVTAAVPDGELVYAVGDIHGRADLLARLLADIEQDAARHPRAKVSLIFVGDYVDRGPDSRGVVEMLLHDVPAGFQVHFLKGNHEQMLLDFLAEPGRIDHWRSNGGELTLRSYGVDVDGLAARNAPPEVWRQAFADALPPSHLDFFRNLDLQHTVGDYAFVHAGVRPGVPLDDQDAFDLLWIRHEFLNSRAPFGKIVVHGHTPVMEPDIRSNRIGIDTGAVFSGQLTALRLMGDDVGFLQTAA